MPIGRKVMELIYVWVIAELMTVLDTFFAGGCAAEFAAQVTFQGVPHRAGCTGSGLDAKLLEELDCPASHAAAEHDISALILYEAGHLAGLVACVKRVIDHFHSFDIFSFDLDESKEGAAPKVMGHEAVQSIIGFC